MLLASLCVGHSSGLNCVRTISLCRYYHTSESPLAIVISYLLYSIQKARRGWDGFFFFRGQAFLTVFSLFSQENNKLIYERRWTPTPFALSLSLERDHHHSLFWDKTSLLLFFQFSFRLKTNILKNTAKLLATCACVPRTKHRITKSQRREQSKRIVIEHEETLHTDQQLGPSVIIYIANKFK